MSRHNLNTEIRIESARQSQRQLDGRRFCSLSVPPSEKVTLPSFMIGEESARFLVSVLDGVVKSPAGYWSDGTIACTRSLEGFHAGPDAGCTLGIVALASCCDDIDGNEWSQVPELTWYDKYQACLGVVDGDLGGWSAYSVESKPNQTPVTLHVHRTLENLIFVRGRSGVTNGYVVAETKNGILAEAVCGGDIILVRRDVRHNVVPKASKETLGFFVFNSLSSNYQEPASSDYHPLETSISRELLIYRRRTITESAMFEVS